MAIIILLLATVIFYHVSSAFVPGNFGELKVDGHQWLTGSTLKFTQYWLDSNPFKLHFLMLENPDSIEFAALQDRQAYVSYPPGTIMPIWMICKLTGHYVSVNIIKNFDAFIQFIMAFLSGILVFYVCVRIKLNQFHAFLLSVLASAAMIFSPSLIYYMRNVFFSDQAVLLWLILFYILETMITDQKSMLTKYGNRNKDTEDKEKEAGYTRVWATILKSVWFFVVFMGTLTDWVFFVVLFISYVLRLLNGFMIKPFNFKIFVKKTLGFFSPAILTVILFAIQIFSVKNGFEMLKNRFLFRTSIQKLELSNSDLMENFRKFLNYAYGQYAFYIVIGVMIVILYFWFHKYYQSMMSRRQSNEKQVSDHKMIRKQVSDHLDILLNVSTMIAVPLVIHSMIFLNHSGWHEFSILKYSFLYAVVFLIFIPLLISERIKEMLPRFSHPKVSGKQKRKLYIKHFHIIFIVIFCVLLYPKGKTLPDGYPFGKIRANIQDYYTSRSDSQKEEYITENFIRENTGYNDVVFSFDMEIICNNPVFISQSKKRVYKIDDLRDIWDLGKGLPENAVINLLVINEDDHQEEKTNAGLRNEHIHEQIRSFMEEADVVYGGREQSIYKMGKVKFEQFTDDFIEN